MLLKKEGYPEEGELVLCTVNNIQIHSVFVKLDEYDKTGLIHISEISPGRIRNIRDFVSEGRKIVCLVLKVNLERGHIDLSLRRVNENQKRNKINDIKQEQLAEKIVEFVAKKIDVPLTNLYKQITEKIFKKYYQLYPCFQAVSKGEESLAKLGIDEKIAAALDEPIKQRIKDAEVDIKGELFLTTYAPKGVEIIKEALAVAEAAGKEKLTLRYKGSGKYKINVHSNTYKDAEKVIENIVTQTIEFMEKHKGQASFSRSEE